MYSVVLMMALSGGADATEFGRNGCNGCNGCWGGGGGCHGGGHRHGGGGCYGGGCYGGGWSGGCTGSWGCSGCHGGGGLFHRRSNGCCGCSGGGYYSGGCYGGGYSGGCYGGGYYGGGVIVTPKKEMPPDPKEKKGKTEISAPATIVVTLPAESKLTIDGYQSTSTGERRVLLTPALPVGQDYVYTLQAELVRDGRPVVQTQTITVRGGETTAAPFTFAPQSVASR